MRAALPEADDDGQEGRPFPPDLHDARHLQLKAGLLLVWALVSFGSCFFARELTLALSHWQLGYWVAAQGTMLIFIAIVVAYASAMSCFERRDAAAAAAAAAENLPATGHCPHA